MSTETEEFIADEELRIEREADTEIGRDFERESPGEPGLQNEESEDVADEKEDLEPGLQAVLDQKGGEKDDWALEYKGDSGYRFDGENVRDPEGNIWTNKDAALHQEMLTQWAEGGNSIFFLPDYRESTEDRDTLFVTMMILGEKGEVTYEIHKYETLKSKYEGETTGPEEDADAEIRYADFSEEEDEPMLAEESFEYTAFEAEVQITETEPVSISEEPSDEVHATQGFEAHSIETQTTGIGLAEHGTEQVRNTDTTEKNGPDQWLVDLLKVDFDPGDLERTDAVAHELVNNSLDYEENTDASPKDESISIQGDHPEQESITIVSDRAVDTELSAPAIIATAIPSSETRLAEPLPILSSNEQSQTEQLMTVDMLESISTQHIVEPEMSVAIQETHAEVSDISMPRSETPILERVVNASKNHNLIASLDHANIPQRDSNEHEQWTKIKHETTSKKTGEAKPQAPEYEQFLEPSRSQDLKNSEQTRELLLATEKVKAEEILRTLGLPMPIKSTESFGTRRIRDDVPYIPPTPDTRSNRQRADRSVRTSERYGVTMEMAA